MSEFSKKPVIFAGPCLAESKELLNRVADFLLPLCTELNFELVFKASFTKANRTSGESPRGPGIHKGLQWLSEVKQTFGVPIITDIHKEEEAHQVAEVADVLQIPAFLCRQTELLQAAGRTHCDIHIKKGQFLAPESMESAAEKVKAARPPDSTKRIFLGERGSFFGYQDLVVDMRAFQTMASTGYPVIFDCTHSVQTPPQGKNTTGGNRHYIPALVRAALATGFCSGLFMEVHPNPAKALSDAGSQLDFKAAEKVLRNAAKMWSFLDENP